MATPTAAPPKPSLDSAQRAWLTKMGAALDMPVPAVASAPQATPKGAPKSQSNSPGTGQSAGVAAPTAESPPDPNAEKFEKETLKVGSKGPAVEHLQKQLNANGASLEVDGKFGPATEKAVKEFQKSKSLAVDGAVGKNPWAALKAGKPAPPAPPDTKPRRAVVIVSDIATNNAVEDAVVKIGDQTEETGDTGRATFSLPPGKHLFGVTADGFEQAIGTFEVTSSDESQLTVELKAGERRSTTVLSVSPPEKSNKGDKLELTATVTMVGVKAAPKGRVRFDVVLNEGGLRQQLAIVELKDGTAKHTESKLPKGIHHLDATFTPTPETKDNLPSQSKPVKHEVQQDEKSEEKEVANRIAAKLDENDGEGIQDEIDKLQSGPFRSMRRLLNVMVFLQKARKLEKLVDLHLRSDKPESERIGVAALTSQRRFTSTWFKFFQKLNERDRKAVLARTPPKVIAEFELDKHPVDPPDPNAEPDDPNAVIVIEPGISTKAKITFHSPSFGFRKTTPEFEVEIGPNGQVKGSLKIDMEVVKKEIKGITALGPVLDLEGKVSLSAGAEFEQHKNEIIAEVQASVKGEFQLKFPEIRGVWKNVALTLEIQFDLDGKFQFGGAISIPIPSL